LKNYQTPVAVVNTSPSDSSQGNDDLLIDTLDDVSVLVLSEYILREKTDAKSSFSSACKTKNGKRERIPHLSATLRYRVLRGSFRQKAGLTQSSSAQ